MTFDLNSEHRKIVFEKTIEKLEHFYSNTSEYPVTSVKDVQEIRDFIDSSDLEAGSASLDAIEHVIAGLEKYTVHTAHSKYFGLFNPRANYAGIMGDLISAYFNPQLAAWSHAPFAVEVEAKIINELADKFGYDRANSDGVFATGGNEANQTAVLCALNNKHSNFAKDGLLRIMKKPIIFCSEEAHHSIQKAAKTSGLGYNSVRVIPANDDQTMNVTELERAIIDLSVSDEEPLMIIATAGTTGVGAIDDLAKIGELASKHDIWFHVDAAYGGGAALSKRHKHLLRGIELSNSITFDAHKWMSVPMGASVFLTSNSDVLAKTFTIATEYMPKEADEFEIVDPFSHSIQWSRRLMGLKIYLSLLFYGWRGYDETINKQIDMGDLLRSKLRDNGWNILNKTQLPVICFTDNEFIKDKNFTKVILEKIYEKGVSWFSVYPVNGVDAFRICITNYNTAEKDLDELIGELNFERNEYLKSKTV